MLRRIEIEGEPPAAGTKTEAVEIMSAVFSPALGKAVALAYVKTQFAEAGTELVLSGTGAGVVKP